MRATTSRALASIRGFRFSPKHHLVLLTLAVAAAAAVLFLGAIRRLPAVHLVGLPWWVWAAAFAASEIKVVHVQFDREAYTFSVSDLVFAAGMFLTVPSHLVLAQLTGNALALVLHRRQTGLKLAYNLAQAALVGCLAMIVFTTLYGVTGGSRWWDWLPALAAVFAATVVSDVFIFAAISLTEGRADLRRIPGMLALSLPFTLGSAAVGLVIVRSAIADPMALVLLALPTTLIIAAYRTYTRAREQQQNLRVLHEVTSLLHRGDTHDALGEFLRSARSAFRAEVTELILLAPDGKGFTVSRSSEGAEPVVMEGVAQPEVYDTLLRIATSSGAGTLRTRTGRGRRMLQAYAAEQGLKDAMVTALRTEERVHGLLLVGGRVGDVSTFNSSDITLLETFARHVATSLERGRLEETLRQVTHLKEQLRHQALHDPLTGLANRTLFLDRIRHAFDAARRTRAFPTVLYLDLDGFKPVNDTYGHEAGDVLLRAVGDRIRGCLRPADTAARLGGDEFAVLLNGPIGSDGVATVVERICAQLDVPVPLGDGLVASVSASIGVAVGDHRTEGADGLVRQADTAMYVAKRSGGHRFVVYEPALDDDSPARQDDAAQLAAAVHGGGVVVAYQPLIDVRTGRPIGAEALVRLRYPDGLRTPDQFVALAEETGLITEIGRLVLQDACAQAARWVASQGHTREPDAAEPDAAELDAPELDAPEILVTVNLSVRQLADRQIVEHVGASLRDSGLEPHRLVLEITETVLMHDREAAAATLWQLKELGVRIAIDDFGTGYSSLAYLRRFPIDMLKVAREFVDGLGRDPNDDVITRAIVELANTLGLLTVAEGIETRQQQEHVASLGCDFAQGYLFSHPVDSETVRSLVVTQSRPVVVVGPRTEAVPVSTGSAAELTAAG